MGKWEDKLQKILQLSADNKKMNDEYEARWQKTFSAAQAFMTTHARLSVKVKKSYSDLMDAEEKGGVAVAELSVYEEEYDVAKKAKDKDQMDQLDKKMKPLIKSWDDAVKKHASAAEEMKKTGEEIESAREALAAAAG
jgi:hypothetical protein